METENRGSGCIAVRPLTKVFPESLDPLRGPPEVMAHMLVGLPLASVLLLSLQGCWHPLKTFFTLGLKAMYACP